MADHPSASSSPSRANRVGAVLGVLSVVVSVGAIVAAILISPQFSWLSNALSDLGRASWESTLVFNYGLIVAGLLALPVGIILARTARTLLHAAGSIAFSLSAVCLSLIGVFALPASEHGLVAIGFFLSFTVGFFLYGAGDVRAGARRWGFLTVGLGIVHILTWILWIEAGEPGGLAIPEIAGAACLSVWILGTAVQFW